MTVFIYLFCCVSVGFHQEAQVKQEVSWSSRKGERNKSSREKNNFTRTEYMICLLELASFYLYFVCCLPSLLSFGVVMCLHSPFEHVFLPLFYFYLRNYFTNAAVAYLLRFLFVIKFSEIIVFPTNLTIFDAVWRVNQPKNKKERNFSVIRWCFFFLNFYFCFRTTNDP